MIGISLLGSTGSIGCNTLSVISEHPERFNIVALAANTNIDRLYQQCLNYKPQFAVMHDKSSALVLKQRLHEQASSTEVLGGTEALEFVATHSSIDYVVAGIVGAQGLPSCLAAVKAGKRVLLANKEALVMAGEIFMQAVNTYNAELLPVDSEHNAIFQCLPQPYRAGEACANLHRVILTASGGAFRDLPLHELKKVTPTQACDHPNWKMGRKITVDCATMVNKALEIIEAYWLFKLSPQQIEVVLHPQSIIHSMVEYNDGSILAQMGEHDMRIPIAYCLAWPQRIRSGVNFLNMLLKNRIDFYELDLQRYPSLNFAYQVLQQGGTAATVFNAANEIAVHAFLNEQIGFTGIYQLIDSVLNKFNFSPATDLATVLEVDQAARRCAMQQIAKQTLTI